MQQPIPITTFIIIGITVYLSYLGFSNAVFFERYRFNIGAILGKKEYHRLISSAFLHGDLAHLIFNTICFYSFAEEIELIFGRVVLLGIYFLSMLAGNLLSLLIHKKNYDYSAVGASGAVSGVIFSSIFLLPGGSVMMLLIPIPIPASLFAVAYTAISIYGIRSQRDNIGHEAHLGGAIAGMLSVAIVYPKAVFESWIIFTFIMIIVIGFLLYSLKNPLIVPNEGLVYIRRDNNQAHSEIKQQAQFQKELDSLLDKVKEKGMHKLSRKEKKRLNFLAKELNLEN